ncbi:thymidylate synthase [Roseiarcaceae bacterium H3SJ34-1]|uniref:thymidylate synthase n=1 Tax=Terripilifer ovatus TaxID=3032367 RepID=UPI003AB92A8B|nr:thymidylate synthase [Roseiarcaceae bacterium H3SJ34-1]
MFYKSSDNIDDLMRAVFARLLSNNTNDFDVRSSRKGDSREIFGVLLELTNPRARISRSQSRARIYSSLGELIWYISSNNSIEFIEYYIPGYSQFSDDGKTANGAYGPRIFSKGIDNAEISSRTQWQRVIDTLSQRNGSRNGIIQIFANRDAEIDSNDIPCTCTLHFAIRNDKVHLHTHMRSNDAFLGLPHDIFSFTMLQEIAARQLNCEIGSYQHSVASLHLYSDTDKRKFKTLAQAYLDEGLHDPIQMPRMPDGNPWPSLNEVIKAEAEIRKGNRTYGPTVELNPYWTDFLTLLRIYYVTIKRHGIEQEEAAALIEKIIDPTYKLFVLDRIERKLGPARRLLKILTAGKIQ